MAGRPVEYEFGITGCIRDIRIRSRDRIRRMVDYELLEREQGDQEPCFSIDSQKKSQEITVNLGHSNGELAVEMRPIIR